MPEPPAPSRGIAPWVLTVYVGAVVAAAVLGTVALLCAYPIGTYPPRRLLGLAAAALVLHILNQINFTIRFSGQKDNVEITFTEAALVALFFIFDPGVVTVLSGAVHLVREIQAHRRRRIQVVFNVAEVMVSLALAGFVYQGVRSHFGRPSIIVAIVGAMLTHSVSNRLLVGTVISLNAGGFRSGYFRSLFVENAVMLFMNLALGMTAVMALLLGQPWLLWVPVTILAVVYVGYQAYVTQMRDAHTLTRLYENALLTHTESEATLVPRALAKALDTFSARRVFLAMASGPNAVGVWDLQRDRAATEVLRRSEALSDLPGATEPVLLADIEPEHPHSWRRPSHPTRMAAPVQYEGQLLAVLGADNPRAWDAFTPGDLRAFALFARQLGVALENVRLSELDREQQRLRQKALDAERNRISRDLHDSFIQTLVQMDLHVTYLARLAEKRPADVTSELELLRENVRDGLAEARDYMAALRPLRIEPAEFLGVAQRYLDDFGRQYDMQTEMISDGTVPDLDPGDVSELFQITREALNNVARHSEARSVRLFMETTEHHFTIIIRDDGVGFDIREMARLRSEGHFGLANIAERANGLGASVDWDTAPGRGTTLTVTAPRRTPSDVLRGVPA
jgi:signal transduction histidine kinase